MTWVEGRSGSERRQPGGSQAGRGPQFQRRSDDQIYEEIRDARWPAEDLVNSVSGVREVTNRLKVAR
jgi:osmotically-inducible protein OsmY